MDPPLQHPPSSQSTPAPTPAPAPNTATTDAERIIAAIMSGGTTLAQLGAVLNDAAALEATTRSTAASPILTRGGDNLTAIGHALSRAGSAPPHISVDAPDPVHLTAPAAVVHGANIATQLGNLVRDASDLAGPSRSGAVSPALARGGETLTIIGNALASSSTSQQQQHHHAIPPSPDRNIASPVDPHAQTESPVAASWYPNWAHSSEKQARLTRPQAQAPSRPPSSTAATPFPNSALPSSDRPPPHMIAPLPPAPTPHPCLLAAARPSRASVPCSEKKGTPKAGRRSQNSAGSSPASGTFSPRFVPCSPRTPPTVMCPQAPTVASPSPRPSLPCSHATCPHSPPLAHLRPLANIPSVGPIPPTTSTSPVQSPSDAILP
ncbi:hypothetical protein OF83DRAFT_149815 [Amylostereum chailletii]|nr:hypothetical protein OF83DRAFT_149815 [Amylostereum chailletii]